MPSFAVGRTQELLYLFARHYREWGVDRFALFLDSPMAIQATRVYLRHEELYDRETASLWTDGRRGRDLRKVLPNLSFTASAEQSMRINRIRSGAIIIAGSGMCNGGRVRHHLKHNLWRSECQVVISGFQAAGTPGRRLVDGASYLRLWGETVKVNAAIHTIGGLSAHADQAGLLGWYGHFRHRPPLLLVHGESGAQEKLAETLQESAGVTPRIPQRGQWVDLEHLPRLELGGEQQHGDAAAPERRRHRGARRRPPSTRAWALPTHARPLPRMRGRHRRKGACAGCATGPVAAFAA